MFLSGFLTPPSICNILTSAEIAVTLRSNKLSHFSDTSLTYLYYMYRHSLYIKRKLIVCRKQPYNYYVNGILFCAIIVITK